MNTQLESLLELGEVLLENNGTGQHILFLSVIGEIEGHHLSSDRIKTTKYEHLLPLLTQVQDNQEIDGLFLLINTVGGDCSCGLAAAEMIASIKKPTVSLVIGDSHWSTSFSSGRSNIYCTDGNDDSASSTTEWYDYWCAADI